MDKIIIASPHPRNDETDALVRAALPAVKVIRIRERSELNEAALANLNPQWIFFPHWSWIVPTAIHTRYRCVIFHMTDLPYGRGGSPLQNLIIRGHKETKISALRCSNELDSGSIYLKRDLSLEGTAEVILRRAAAAIAQMIIDIVQNNPEPIPQDGNAVVFERRTPRESNVGLVDDISTLYDFIRMLDAEGYPKAFVETDFMRMELHDATLEDDFIQARVLIRKK